MQRLPLGQPLTPRQVLRVGLGAFLLGALLNAPSLDSLAHRQPFGWRRTLAVAAVTPVRAVADATRIDRPHEWLADATGHALPHTSRGGAMVASRTTVPPSRPGATTTTAPAGPPTLRRATAADPLRVWVGGDSMSREVAESVARLVAGRSELKVSMDFRVSTGLTRPDYFDWPGHLAADVLPSHPEVAMVMFGANDAQRMEINGHVVDVESAEWQAEYRHRVEGVMDELRGAGRLVIWIGQPVMRGPSFSNKMRILDGIYQQAAASRPWVRYLDTLPLFAGSDGNYAAYLPGSDGRPVLMRQSDGVHLSRAGGDRLAAAVVDILDRYRAEHTAPRSPVGR